MHIITVTDYKTVPPTVWSESFQNEGSAWMARNHFRSKGFEVTDPAPLQVDEIIADLLTDAEEMATRAKQEHAKRLVDQAKFSMEQEGLAVLYTDFEQTPEQIDERLLASFDNKAAAIAAEEPDGTNFHPPVDYEAKSITDLRKMASHRGMVGAWKGPKKAEIVAWLVNDDLERSR